MQLFPPWCTKECSNGKAFETFVGESEILHVGISLLGNTRLRTPKGALFENYLKSMILTIEHIIQKFNAVVVIIPQVSDSYEKRIMQLAAKILKNRKNVLVIDEDLKPEKVMYLIGRMDIFIGTRMHSNISALIMNVPTLAVAYEHKTWGIMSQVGLKEWVIGIEIINEHDLSLKFDELFRRRDEVKQIISQKIAKTRRLSLQNATIVKNWYRNNSSECTPLQ
jgi:colanic acid/amylovoran biosynthesis protein